MLRLRIGICVMSCLFLSGALGLVAAADDPPKPDAAQKKPEQKPDASGTWIWTREIEGQSAQSMLKLVQKDGKLSGTYKRQEYEFPVQNAKLEGEQFSCDFDADIAGRKLKIKFNGQLKGDLIVGKSHIAADEGVLDLDWEAKRGIDPADLVGKWTFRIELSDGNIIEPTLVLSREKDQFKGAYSSPPFGDFEPKDIKVDGAEFSFVISGENDGRKFKVTYAGKPAGNDIKGSIRFEVDGESRAIDFTGKRADEKKDAGAKEEKKP